MTKDLLGLFLEYEKRAADRMSETTGERPPEGAPIEGLRAFVRRTLGKHPARFDVERLLARKRDWVPVAIAKDADALEAFLTAHRPEDVFKSRELTLRLYLKMGALFYNLGYRYSRDTIQAASDLHAGLLFLERYRMHGAAVEVWKLIDSALLVVDSWVGLWFRIGCPRVALRREEAAALALTESTADLFVDAQAPTPWPQFLVDVPEGALSISDGGVERHVDRIMMHRFETGEATVWLTLVGCGPTLYVTPNLSSVVDMVGHVETSSLFSRVECYGGEGAVHAPIGADAMRGLQCAARIAAGVCFALENRKAAGDRRVGRESVTSRVGGMPKTTDFRLGLPIDVDFSEHLREYTLGHRKVAHKSQWVVRGHWRNQAVGKGRLLRKLTWIKPFWKGPASAPILVREHHLPVK